MVRLALGVLLCFVSPLLFSQDTGFKYLRNYSFEEYDHAPQNWDMVQAGNGMIYVANQGGGLEFDGVSWRVIYIPGVLLRSITIDETGTIYVGGINEIGYLAPDITGTLKYVSLVDEVKEENREFGTVWSTLATKEGIFFRASNCLFCWDPNIKKMETWSSNELFWSSFVCDGCFYVNEKKKGLFKIVKGTMRALPGTEIFKDNKIYFMASFDNDGSGQLLIGTRAVGFQLYDGKIVKPFNTEADNYLEKNRLSQGIRLSSGEFAMATLQGGCVIIDAEGRLKVIFNKAYGLQDEDVKYVFQDIQGNLWLCLNNGISKIEYTSPISTYDERSNLPGLVFSVVRHHNGLYAGTGSGLYYLESPLKFRQLPGISEQCLSLLSIRGSILAATGYGVFQVDTQGGVTAVRRVVKDQSYILMPSKQDSGCVWCGAFQSLVVLSVKNDSWEEKHRFEIPNQEIQSIAEDANGTLWLGTKTGDVYTIISPTAIPGSKVIHYDVSHGLPGTEIFAAAVAHHVVFATAKGLYRFDEKKKTFIPDTILGNEWSDGSKPIFRIVEDKGKNIWFHSESRNYQAVPNPKGSFNIIFKPFLRIPVTCQVNAIYPDPAGKATWFASHGGLIRFDRTAKKNYSRDFHTLVRKVQLNEKQVNESLLFYGHKNDRSNGGRSGFPIIEFKDRNLYFEFAAPAFESETETRYKCLLEGYDNDWSTWNKETFRYYTNLDPGRYAFRVKAQNIYRHEGMEGVFQFKILPPWYLTWWFYIIYAVLFLGAVFLVVKWRSRRLEQEKLRLEQIVHDRTREVYDKNELLEEQSQKLKELDQVKSRFFANISHEFRTPLTLILSPLERMLSISRDKEQQRELNVMLRNSRRLLTLINQLLDLSRIDSGRMKLQAGRQNIVPFLKGILSSFHLLVQQNQLHLEFQPEKEEISFYFDPAMMEELIVNLLMNAVKFTPAGGGITVSVSRPFKAKKEPGDYVEISVRDTGIGIPREHIVHIFDRFYQAGKFKEKYQKGTGIGLALAKEIVALHRGTIDVHSREGKGTEFVIRLPMGKAHLKPGEIVESLSGGDESRVFKQRAIQAELDEPESQGKEDPPRPDERQEKPLILVVEDDKDVRKYILGPLRQDYAVLEAADGKEGIKKAKEFIPDLIVSDIMMPEADGYELCKVLKKNIDTCHIPIILLTAKASEEAEIQGLRTGADDYVTKPFNTQLLLIRIRNLIDLRRQFQLKIQRQKMLLPSEIQVSSMDETFLKEFQQAIEKNLSDPDFDIDMLCEKLYMSRPTLFRKIQALTGETPNQFILSYRLERGARLLRGNFGNITEVAMAVGFSSSQYFAQCFKKKFQQSPSSYKASQSV